MHFPSQATSLITPLMGTASFESLRARQYAKNVAKKIPANVLAKIEEEIDAEG